MTGRPTRPVRRPRQPEGSRTTQTAPRPPVRRGRRQTRVAVGAAGVLVLMTTMVVALHGQHAQAGPGVPVPAPAPHPTAGAVPEPEPDRAPVDCAVERCVALTFDDGPGPYTARLLDELAARSVPATFFVVGRQVAARPDLVAREHAEGHAVGDHTWDHRDLTTLAPDQIADEVDRTAQAVQDATGTSPTLVRPPYGAVDDDVLSVLEARGETAVLWDVDTEDWRNRDAAETTRRALAGAHPGAIVLLHDVHPTTVDAVPGIVDQLRAQGYTLVTVPELLGGRLRPGEKVFGA